MTTLLVNEGRIAGLQAQLAAIGANLKVGLFTSPATPTVATDLASLVLATFVGYAAQTPAFGAVAIDGNGNALAAGSTLTFTAGAVVGSETIVGWCLYDAVNNKLYFIEKYGAPVVINAAGQFITATPNWYRGLLPPPL